MANQQQSNRSCPERAIGGEFRSGHYRFRYRREKRVGSPRKMIHALRRGPGFRFQPSREVGHRAAEQKSPGFEGCSLNLFQKDGKLEGRGSGLGGVDCEWEELYSRGSLSRQSFQSLALAPALSDPGQKNPESLPQMRRSRFRFETLMLKDVGGNSTKTLASTSIHGIKAKDAGPDEVHAWIARVVF